MSFFTNKKSVDDNKLRGGYYTPLELAKYLVSWGLREDTNRILEPSCGDGNFIMAILETVHLQSRVKLPVEIVAIELIEAELEKARARAVPLKTQNARIEWMSQDFFKAYEDISKKGKFDFIVGNPPFIRFQYFDDDSREIAFSHLKNAGYHPTKLANAWAGFVQLSIELLREGGRLAMVIPAELLQVSYANQLRTRLSKQFEHIVLIGFKKIVFPEIQQEVLLLLADGKRELSEYSSDIHTVELLDGSELLNLTNLGNSVAHIPAKHSRNGMKWTSLFLDESAFKALDNAEQTKGLTSLGKLAGVDVGVVTGRNSFFILKESERDRMEVCSLTVPIIGRTSALKSTIFSQEDFNTYKTQYPCFLLNLNGIEINDFTQLLIDYIKLGEKEGLHHGYKCSIRKRWFDVPSIHIPDLFLFRQIHRYPLLIVNKAKATSTDTIHRVRVKEGTNVDILATIFFNSLTLAWTEVCGRSYGGGVLELEPREAEELPIPYKDDINIDIEKVDSLLRQGLSYEALDYVDGIVLKDYLGFDSQMLRHVRNAWEQLRDRRMERK